LDQLSRIILNLIILNLSPKIALISKWTEPRSTFIKERRPLIYIYIYIYIDKINHIILIYYMKLQLQQWGLLHQIKKCHVGWEEKTNQLSTQGSLSGCFSINTTIGTILMIRLRHYARSMPSWQRKLSIFLFFHLLLAIASEYCTVLCHPIIYSQLQCFNDWC